MRRALVVSAVIFMSSQLHALDYEQLLDLALRNDNDTALLTHRLEITLIEVGVARRTPPLSISAGLFGPNSTGSGVTGTWFITPEAGAVGFESTVTPALLLGLPGRTETSIGLHAPVTMSWSDQTMSMGIAPRLTISQPLGPLLHDDADLLGVLREDARIRDAGVAIWQRSLAVQREFTGLIREVVVLMQSRAALVYQLEVGERKLARERVLQGNPDATPGYQRMLLDQEIADLNVQVMGERLAAAWRELAEMTGVGAEQLAEGFAVDAPGAPGAVLDLPAAGMDLPKLFLDLPDADPELPAAGNLTGRNPDLLRARAVEEIAAMQVMLAEAPADPVWNADASYRLSADQMAGLAAHTIGAGVSGKFTQLALSAGVVAELSEPSIGFSFGFSWSPADAGKRAAELEVLHHNLAIATIAAEESARSADAAIDGFRVEIMELEIRAHRLERLDGILSREIESARAAFNAGLTDESRLLEAQRSFEDLFFERLKLKADRILLAVRIEGMTLPPDVPADTAVR